MSLDTLTYSHKTWGPHLHFPPHPIIRYPGQGRPSWTVPGWRGASHPVCFALTTLHLSLYLSLKANFSKNLGVTGLQ